jgi:predicted transcriptional regulator
MEEIKQLHKAHTSLYTTLQNQQNSMQSVTTDMKTLHEGVSKAILTYNKHIVSLHGTVAELKSMIESTKKEQKERIMQPVVQKSEPKIEHVYQRPEKPPISNQEISTVRQIASSLTSSERQILLILVGTDQKLSYRDIAVNYGRSPSTIKNMIIKLKSKGIPLHESSGADGVKRYYVDDSFKKVLASKNF